MSHQVLWFLVAAWLLPSLVGGAVLKAACTMLRVTIPFLRVWIAYLAATAVAIAALAAWVRLSGSLISVAETGILLLAVLAILGVVVALVLNRWDRLALLAHGAAWAFNGAALACCLCWGVAARSCRTVERPTLDEVNRLEEALNFYRDHTGDYPPDFTNPESVTRHLRKRFPNYHGGLPPQFAGLDAASALTFWLGGMANPAGHFIGFSRNPRDPFDNSPSRIGPFFDFDSSQLKKVGNGFWYMPPDVRGDGEPYLYFREYACPGVEPKDAGSWNGCKPLSDPKTGEFKNAHSYQILAPGSDGRYGRPVSSADGDRYDSYGADDCGNTYRPKGQEPCP